MEKSIFITGAGGHGVQSTGKAIAQAAFACGYNVTFSPKYGIEKRGGLSSCYVVISDEEIGNPRKEKSDITVIIDKKSFPQFREDVVPGGILAVNSSLIEDREYLPGDAKRIDIPFHAIAEEVGSSAFSTLVLGFTAGLTGLFADPEVFTSYFPKKVRANEELMELNRRALLRGWAEAGKVSEKEGTDHES